jgi:hypothetical protein
MNKRDQIDSAHNSQLIVRLLQHDQLMTPVLWSEFGEIVARDVIHTHEGDILRRTSALHHKYTGGKVLDAKLEIFIDAVPGTIVQQLSTTEKLFGQLLLENEIVVETRNREVFSHTASDEAVTRWGRRLSLINAADQTVLCRVEELLVPDVELLCLK